MHSLINNNVNNEIRETILINMMNSYCVYSKFKAKANLRINRIIFFDNYLREHINWKNNDD